MGLHPPIADADQPLAFQPLIRHPALRCQRSRQTPVAFAAERRQDRLAFERPQGEQGTHLGAHVAPLFPVAHAQPAAQPVIDLGDRSVIVRNAEVAHPTAHVLGELAEPVRHRHTPASPGQSPDVVLEVREGAIGPPQLGSTEGKTEELAVVGLHHPALALVDRQLELAGQVRRDTGLDPFTGALASDQDHQVIGVARKTVTAPDCCGLSRPA